MNNARPTVLYLTPDLLGPPGGIARYCRLVIMGLVGATQPPYVMALLDNAPTQAPNLPLAGYYPCQGDKLRFARQALRLAWQTRPALILSGHPYFAPLSWLLARLTGARLISFIYGIDAWEPLSFWRRRALQRSDLVIAISGYTAERAGQVNQLPAARLRVLHNCLDPEFVSAAPQPRQERGLRLLTVARISLSEQYKGHDYVIRALPFLRQRFPDLIYDIVGDGDGRPALEALARELQVADMVQFHGFVSVERLRQLYQEAAVFVMPSRAEGFGFVFLEAMNEGLSIVGGNVDATTEVVVDGQTGYLANPQDEVEIGQKLAALLSDPALRQRMGEAGRERVRQEFGLAQFQQTLKAYLAEGVV